MGSSLSEEAKRTFIKAKINAGCIIHYYCDFITPPKNKFIVVVHMDQRENLLLVFFVNSEINPFVKRNPELKMCQVVLKRDKYKFLNHDSFLNCSEVIDQIEIDAVVDHLQQYPNDLKCDLVDSDKLEIIQVVKTSTTITESDKQLIINSLGN